MKTIKLINFTLAFSIVNASAQTHSFYGGVQGALNFNAYKLTISSPVTNINETKHNEYKNTFLYNLNVGYDYQLPGSQNTLGVQVYKLFNNVKYHYLLKPQNEVIDSRIKTKFNYIAAVNFSVPSYNNRLTFKIGQVFYENKINSYDSSQALVAGQTGRIQQKQKKSSPAIGLGYSIPVTKHLHLTGDYMVTRQKNIKISHDRFANLSYKIYSHFVFVGLKYKF